MRRQAVQSQELPNKRLFHSSANRPCPRNARRRTKPYTRQSAEFPEDHAAAHCRCEDFQLRKNNPETCPCQTPQAMT
jgi:hypothetical protein